MPKRFVSEIRGGLSLCFLVALALALGCGGGSNPQTTSPAASPPPAPSITSQPANPSPSTTATFNFTDSQGGVTFLCSLDSAASSACTSGISYLALSPATHTFAIQAKNSAGNSTATTYSWTVSANATAPPPAPTITAEPPNPTISSSATFTFTDTQSGVTFRCSLDGAAFSACISGISYSSLSSSAHTFAVQAQDSVGNASAAATYAWTVVKNVQPIAVDGGPAAFVTVNGSYANGAFTTITVCAPGSTTNCNTIDHVLVDTGSFGLRILSSSSGGELTISLPKSNITGNPLAECIQFADNSFLWGPVETADVKIAGEQASSLPVNVVGDATFSAGSPVPSSCSNSGGPDDDNLNSLGANGILGVGFVQYDCGSACVSGTPPPAAYYQCPASGCVPTLVSLAQQVQNPISLFTSDNNGVIIQLPAASGPEASLAGSMVFGIGTQSDNALGNATVLTLDSSGNFTTTFNGTNMAASFIDSGSNGLFFDDGSLTKCPVNTFFYCPANPTNLSAVNTGANGVNSTVTFTVTNADNAFNTFPSDAVFPGLAGKNDGTSTSFDFGLPFFYGRNVFTSIASTTAAPYWAY